MRKVVPIAAAPPDTPGRIRAARAAIAAEYGKRHRYPWIVAYSGGKDSTLLLQLVFELLLKLPPEERRREVHIVGNDTLVESPPVIEHLKRSLDKIRKSVAKHKLPVRTTLTRPDMDQTFWVNVIGRGYIPPTRNFRWCTDRLKIRPANDYIERLVRANKKALLLVGTRKSESATRRRRMEKRGGQINPHSSIKGCRMFSPLAEISDDEVWITLLQRPSPWGGHNRELATIYRNGSGGECPFVLSKDDAPSCGTASPRFGCWTCTVVAKDRSMSGLLDSGFDEFEPLFDFREMLLKLREDPANRKKERRNGEVRFRENGARVMGPFTLEVREKILNRLRELEEETGRQFVSDLEEEIIRDIWERDRIIDESRRDLIERMRIPPDVKAA